MRMSCDVHSSRFHAIWGDPKQKSGMRANGNAHAAKVAHLLEHAAVLLHNQTMEIPPAVGQLMFALSANRRGWWY